MFSLFTIKTQKYAVKTNKLDLSSIQIIFPGFYYNCFAGPYAHKTVERMMSALDANNFKIITYVKSRKYFLNTLYNQKVTNFLLNYNLKFKWLK